MISTIIRHIREKHNNLGFLITSFENKLLFFIGLKIKLRVAQ